MAVDPSTLLCESCGYSIEGLAREGRCPECGRAIVDSLPERRVGTAWQRGRGAGSWARTVWMVMRRPRRVWDVVRVDSASSIALAIWSCGVATAGLLAWWVGVSFQSDWSGAGISAWVVFMLAMSALLGLGTVILLGLTALEFAGISFFGARRRWRVTHDVGWSVVGHASAGWLLLPITLPACWWFASARLAGALNGAQSPGPIGAAATVAAVFAGPLIPLLAFEFLVYFGVRGMRFANVGRPEEAE